MYLDRFGCKFRSNLTGIIYNNQMADFDIPNDTKIKIDGVYPSEVNFPESGKRPFSSLSATTLTKNLFRLTPENVGSYSWVLTVMKHSLGFWIRRCRFWIPGTGFWILVSGTWILCYLSLITDPKAQD